MEEQNTSAAKISCSHKGLYRVAGLLPMQSMKGLSVFVFLFCEQCGEVMAKTMQFSGIQIPGASGIAIPRS